ncbi:MAG: hypothetical protein AAF657_33035 [Acidobacteriota bacterium]
MSESTPRRRLLLHATLVVGCTVVLALYLGWPSLVRADRFHENWRQVPQWLSPDKQYFQDDDLLLRYSEFGTTPFGNALYKTLARTGHDILWGKVMTIVVFALGALSCFLAAHAMSGLIAGWVSVVLFLFFPSMYEHFVGGFMAAFSWPLLGFAVLLIYRQRWWWAVPLVSLSALVYPMVGIHIGMMYLIDTIYHDVRTGRLRDRAFWRTKLLPLVLAALALAAILGAKYFEDHGFGELARRADMQDRIEFTKEGRYRILPTTALWDRIERQWEDSFHFPLLLIGVFFLGRGAFRLPRGVYTLLVASLIMYTVADYFVMQLYLPSRYIRRSLPLFTCLVGGIWWARIVADSLRSSAAKLDLQQMMQRLKPLTVATLLLVGLGLREFGDELEPGEHTRTFKRHELYQAIRELPGRPMIAAWPRLASELPLMTGRTVLVNKEQAHPWWLGLWDEVVERTQEFWRAYYTDDPDELRRVIDRYGIDYWVVEPRYFRRGRRSMGHFEPLESWVEELAQSSPRPLLSRVPPDLRLYADKRHFLVASSDLLQWLEER